jgi:hypothetical protein
VKKPTPDEIARFRAAYAERGPVITYREMDLVVGRAAAPDDGDAEDAADGGADEEEEQRAAADNAPIEAAISSESSVLRYDYWEGEYYYEVLDHSAKSVDLSRAADGLPFIMSHRSWDADAQHGIVENVRVDKDRKLRGDIRMSRSQRGQEIAQDLRDGIRKKVSVGYIVGDEFTQEKTKGSEYPTRRYMSWMPLEVSTVPIPADNDVGIGRAQSSAGQAALSRFLELHPAARSEPHAPSGGTMKDEQSAPNGGTPNAPAITEEQRQAEIRIVRDATREAENKRIESIRALGSLHNCSDKVDGWISEGKTELDVTREINTIYVERAKKNPPTQPGSRGIEGLGEGISAVQLREGHHRLGRARDA